MKRVAVLTAFVLVAMFAALSPPGIATQAQGDNCTPETGFCMTTPQFAEYYRLRGGSKTLGFPISRTFTLEGFQVQFFQRVVLQLQGNTVNRLNVLDPTIMPMTRVNQSQFPPNDPQLASQAPSTSSPSYATDVVQFIQRVSPNTFNGQNVNFFNTFNNAVPADAAGGNPGLQTLLNLEIWGLPTSNPAADPGNGGFIYQRYQRGIMHFDAACGCTQGILVGEWFKSVITGRNLPPDLAADMQGSRFLGQYNSANQNWLNRPGELPNTDLTGAFEPGTGQVQPGSGQPTPGPTSAAGTATPTPIPSAVGPTVTIQVDDDLIDPGQSVKVTVIARYTGPIRWIEFEGIESDNNNENDNDASDDAALARQRFDCGDLTECANVWTVSPTVANRYTLRARAEGRDNVRSEWVGITFRVRGGTPSPTTTTATPTAVVVTATPTTAAATPTATTAAATATPTTAAATPTPTKTP